jgi:hypothetical protein
VLLAVLDYLAVLAVHLLEQALIQRATQELAGLAVMVLLRAVMVFQAVAVA